MINNVILIFLASLQISGSIHVNSSKESPIHRLTEDTIKEGQCNEHFFLENEKLRFYFDSATYKSLGELFRQSFFEKNKLVNLKTIDCKEIFRTNEWNKSTDLNDFNDPICKSEKIVSKVKVRDFKREKDKYIIELAFSYCNIDVRRMDYRLTYKIVKKHGIKYFRVISFEFLGEEI